MLALWISLPPTKNQTNSPVAPKFCCSRCCFCPGPSGLAKTHGKQFNLIKSYPPIFAITPNSLSLSLRVWEWDRNWSRQIFAGGAQKKKRKIVILAVSAVVVVASITAKKFVCQVWLESFLIFCFLVFNWAHCSLVTMKIGMERVVFEYYMWFMHPVGIGSNFGINVTFLLILGLAFSACSLQYPCPLTVSTNSWQSAMQSHKIRRKKMESNLLNSHFVESSKQAA